MASWEEMAEQVIVLGRPGDVRGAAQGWQQLLQGCEEVKTSLEQNVTDLNKGWKGPAYESFKTHIKAIAKQLDDMVKSAKVDDGIVGALNGAAEKLEQAQQAMPVPAVCTADIIEARNVQASIPMGFFTLKLKSSLLSGIASIPLLAHAEYQLIDWINDKSDDAKKVYDKVQGQYQDQTYRTPGTPSNAQAYDNLPGVTNNATSGLGGGGGLGGMPKTGGMPKGSSLGGNPPGMGKLPGTGTGLGSGGLGSGGLGSGAFDPSSGGGLAGAGDGLSGAGLGGGLGSGLGGAGGGLGGAGLGAGGLAGGGAAGKGVMPSMGGLMGGAGAGGGGKGSGASRRGAMAGGQGGGHGDSEDERTTWLQEDDDPWGTGDGAPSGVLK